MTSNLNGPLPCQGKVKTRYEYDKPETIGDISKFNSSPKFPSCSAGTVKNLAKVYMEESKGVFQAARIFRMQSVSMVDEL